MSNCVNASGSLCRRFAIVKISEIAREDVQLFLGRQAKNYSKSSFSLEDMRGPLAEVAAQLLPSVTKSAGADR